MTESLHALRLLAFASSLQQVCSRAAAAWAPRACAWAPSSACTSDSSDLLTDRSVPSSSPHRAAQCQQDTPRREITRDGETCRHTDLARCRHESSESRGSRSDGRFAAAGRAAGRTGEHPTRQEAYHRHRHRIEHTHEIILSRVLVSATAHRDSCCSFLFLFLRCRRRRDDCRRSVL